MSRLVSDSNENLLRINLSKFFTDLEQDIQKALFEYWSNTDLKKGQVNLILAPIHEKHQEYYELIMNHKLNEFRRSERIGTLLVFNERQKKHVAMKAENPVNFEHSPNNLFGTLSHTEQTLANQTFTASEGTLKRVDSNINDILTDGYKSGKGIDVVSKQITERFDQLRTWESTRIARTEIHGAQNQGIMSTYESLGVEYTQWVAASDDRTRDSHVEIDGEIIRMGDTYSNGLSFPGDTSGPIEEWINCRCSVAPFVIPYGYIAPSFSPFREEDLVPIENPVNPLEQLQEQTTEPQIQVPTDEQLKSNLTKEEMDIVRWARDIQNNEFIKPAGKAKARQQLEELYQKALDGSKPKVEKVPPQTVTAEPLKPKTKIVEEQPVKPKTVKISETDRINRMTSEELYESMTKADKKKYDKFKKNLENGRKYDIPQIIEHNLLEMRKLEQKQRDKLLKRTQPRQKPKPSPYKRDLDNIHKDIDIPTKELIPTLEKWIKKRCKNTAEFGYNFDIKTGKFIGDEIRGKKGHVSITDLGENTGTIHSHPRNGMSIPSDVDLEGFRCQKGQHHFMVSEHEIWYVHATDSFGKGAFGQQLDLQDAHKACRDRAYDRIAKEIKEGKIEATEESITFKLNEYTGNEILKTFNSPPWSKTMTVKRYYI